MAQVFMIRTINGSAPPMPSAMTATKYVIDKDSYRSASGLLIRNILTSKMKFTLKYPPMTKTALQAFLALLDNDTLSVQYENLVTGALITGTFYHNDFVVEPHWIKSEDNTNVIHKEFEIHLIEY